MSILMLGLATALWCHYLWETRKQLNILQQRLGAFAALSSVALFVWLSPNRVIWQKILGTLAMPVGCLWLAMWGYAAYLWHHKRRKASGLVFLGIAIYGILGNGMISHPLMRWLERDYMHINPYREKPFDAILVLGGTTRMDHHGNAYVTDSGDRVLLAARMYAKKQATYLVTSGTNIPGTKAANKARETSQIWRSLGIPKRAIIWVIGPYNTSMEVLAFRRLIRQKGWQRVGILTSAWHMRRTMKLARRAGLRVHPLPADFRGGHHNKSLMHMIPTGDGFRAMHIACWELLGAFVGR